MSDSKQISQKVQVLDLFVPPEGYETDFVELTTFTLDLNFLSLIPALIYGGNQGYIKENALIQDEISILQTNHRKKSKADQKFRVLYDQEANAVFFSKQEPAFPSLASCLLGTQCKAIKKSGYFHPKIMLFQYKSKTNEDDYRYRLFMGSRNLVFSNYLELGVCFDLFDLAVNEKESGKGELEKVSDFFSENWKEHPTQASSTGIHWDKFVKKALPRGVSIHFTGETNFYKKISVDAQKAKEFHVISMNPTDFWNISKGEPPKNFTQNPPTYYIANPKDVSDYNANKNTSTAQQNPPSPICCLKKVQKSGGTSKIPEFQPLHGKCYKMYQEKQLITWIGSANCSHNALNTKNNTEVMVRLEEAYGEIPKLVEDPGNYDKITTYFYDDSGQTSKYYYDFTGQNTEEVESEEPKITVPNLSFSQVSYDKKTKMYSFTGDNDTGLNYILSLGKAELGILEMKPLIQEAKKRTCTVQFRLTSGFQNLLEARHGEECYVFLLDFPPETLEEARKNLSFQLNPNWDLRVLVPRGSGAGTHDQALERLMMFQRKCKNNDDFSKILDMILENIENKRADYHKVYPTEWQVPPEVAQGFKNYYLKHPPQGIEAEIWESGEGDMDVVSAECYRKQFHQIEKFEELVKELKEGTK